MMNKYIIICCLLLISKAGFSQMLTVAESSNFETTSNEKDVNEFIKKITKNSPFVRLETLAVSIEGRKIPLLIIANPLPKSAKDIKNDNLLLNSTVHNIPKPLI